MPRRLALCLFILGVLALNSGCAVNRATATVSPDADLGKLKSFYVVRDPQDSRGVEKAISDNLVKRGFRVTAGPAVTQAPSGTDAVVTYIDKWMWDITMYMLELTVTVRNPTNNFPMATGNSFHTSLSRKSPSEMVDEVLTNIFNAPAKK